MMIIALFAMIPMSIWILTHDFYKMFKEPNSDESRGLKASYGWTIIALIALTLVPLIIMVVVNLIYF